MENYEEQKSSLKDQHCHIFNYGTSAFCLVCKRIILSGITSCESRQEGILHHIHSSDHVESLRSLFKMCIPDPACDTDDRKYLDIITKSIFDVSVLLGEETSYICQKDEHIVCLVCSCSISEITSSFALIKVKITEHLESVMHTSCIKEVCWFFRLNSKDDYLLFHKSILHCSVCQETFQCIEAELLQFSVNHLESNSHELIYQLSVEKTRNLYEELSNDHLNKCDDQGIGEAKNNFNPIKPEINSTIFRHMEYLDQETKLDESMFLAGAYEGEYFDHKNEEVKNIVRNRNDAEESLPILYNKGNLDDQKNLVTSIIDVAGQKTFQNNKCLKKNKLLEALLLDRSLIIKSNHQFVKLTKKKAFCTLCGRSVSCLPGNPKSLIKNLKCHFIGTPHMTKLDMFKARDVENIGDYHEQPELANHGTVSGVVKYTSFDNLVHSVPEHTSDIRSNKKISNTSSYKTQENLCCHPRSNQRKVLGKCQECLKNLFKRGHRGMKKHIKYLIVRKEKCICRICGKLLHGTSVDMIMRSCFTHFESKMHKENLDSFLLEKKERKERKENKKKKCKGKKNIRSGKRANQSKGKQRNQPIKPFQEIKKF